MSLKLSGFRVPTATLELDLPVCLKKELPSSLKKELLRVKVQTVTDKQVSSCFQWTITGSVLRSKSATSEIPFSLSHLICVT